ncbi:MAG: hypothetical protein M1550_07085 [Deltaproteobacteria bacterium]|nr:hypothetical protein [Deltaproteobacteria bacterium]
MGLRDKDVIERRFGPLWSGLESISVGDRIFTLAEIKRAFDLDAGDVVGIDLAILPEERFAYRYYDGDDRCIAVFVFDATLAILEEHRAHIAEWLGDDYYESGIMAFLPDDLVMMLRRKLSGGEGEPPS